MPLPKELLNDNEELVLDLHPHWWYFAQSVATAVVVLVLWVAIDINFSGSFSDLMAKITGFVFAAVVLWVGWQYLQWRTTLSKCNGLAWHNKSSESDADSKQRAKHSWPDPANSPWALVQ